jgi:hypothetical protein
LNFARCPKCGEFDFVKSHLCPPVFHCGNYADECDHPIYAHEADTAAEKFAEFLDRESGEVSGNRFVFVRDPRFNQTTKFEILVYTKPVYSATEVV